jgi:hypothetical protein
MSIEEIVKLTEIKNMRKYKSEITGNLDIFIAQNEDERDGEIIKWQNILIHGDPEGLKSLAMLLLKLADTNQNAMVGLPLGARELRCDGSAGQWS